MQNKTFDSERRSARFARMVDRLRSREWIVPTAMVLLAVGLSFAMEALDEHVKGRLDPVWYLFSGGHTIARQFLSALAAAMVAILTMAFSITVTALTFIGQHYGSRVLRSFMQDLKTQLVIGTFLATFVYALLVLRTVHSASHDSSLPTHLGDIRYCARRRVVVHTDIFPVSPVRAHGCAEYRRVDRPRS